MHRIAHLARRFRGAISAAPPPAADDAWAVRRLTEAEAALWWKMMHQDRRHSVLVARRFLERVPDAPRASVAAALLHDVGKSESRLGVLSRVAATIFGPRTSRWRAYHEHERIGVVMLREAGSDPMTLALLDGTSSDTALLDALRAADDI
jgi:hypothetical protein